MPGTPIVPTTITVHLGRPTANAQNVTINFKDYIKNVASSEIFPTWPESALRANIYCQVSFVLNRVYTEWYRSQGYAFDITNSTQYDQAYVFGRDIFDSINRIVDELFNDYIHRSGAVEPLFAQFCNGTTVTCTGLSQWGSVSLAQNGYTPYQILQNYFGDDIQIEQNAPVGPNIASYTGYPLRLGSVGNEVRTVQISLNRISRNYPLIPKISQIDGIFGVETQDAVRTFQQIFELTADGIVGKATWYEIQFINVNVRNLASLNSEGLRLEDVAKQYPGVLKEGSSGNGVRVIQYYLLAVSEFNSFIPPVTVDGVFGPGTKNAVIAFQTFSGLTPDGIVGNATFYALFYAYAGIRRAIPPTIPVTGAEPFPGVVLKQGMTGRSVMQLQEYLAYLSTFFPGIPIVTVDGVFGTVTYNAVRAFQRLFGLPADGAVGPATWNTITEEYTNLRAGAQTLPRQYPGYPLSQQTTGS